MNNCIRVTVNTQKTCFCPWYRTRWQMVEIINNNKSRTLCIRYLNIHAPFYTFHTFQITLRMRVKAEDSRSEMQGKSCHFRIQQHEHNNINVIPNSVVPNIHQVCDDPRFCRGDTQANNLKERKCWMWKRECWFRDTDKTRRKCGTN